MPAASMTFPIAVWLRKMKQSNAARMPSPVLPAAVHSRTLLLLPTLNPIAVEFVGVAFVVSFSPAMQPMNLDSPCEALKPAEVAALLVFDDAVQFKNEQLKVELKPKVAVLFCDA